MSRKQRRHQKRIEQDRLDFIEVVEIRELFHCQNYFFIDPAIEVYRTNIKSTRGGCRSFSFRIENCSWTSSVLEDENDRLDDLDKVVVDIVSKLVCNLTGNCSKHPEPFTYYDDFADIAISRTVCYRDGQI